MPSSDVRVEVIVNGLKELQQEKSRLEQKLCDLRRQKNVLEKNVEVLTTRRSQTSDGNAKLKETLQVAQNKVSQTQAQIDSLQKIVDVKRSHNQGLSKEIDDCRKSLLDVTRNFEQDLVKLTAMFSDAKHFHEDKSLKDRTVESENAANTLKKRTNELQNEASELSETFERLKIEADIEEEKLLMMPISPSKQEQTFKMFVTENELAKEKLKEMKQNRENLQKELQKLQSMA